MVRARYWLKFEPTGALYKHLIRTAVLEAHVAYVVLPDGTMNPSVQNALEKLNVDEIGRKTVKEWPGTRLLGTKAAMLIEYRCTRSVARVLTSLATGLYDWLAPDLPEDLGFVRTDGSVWLASTSHERCAFLELSSEEASRLTQREPNLVRILQSVEPWDNSR
jgi:hypothetical protein